MHCNVVQDLMILYTDNCCSDESRAVVEAHIKTCGECKRALEGMNAAPTPAAQENAPPLRFTRLREWRASVMQSVLLLCSFVLLTAGVALEAATPAGDDNGLWAVAVIIPTTGFLLSLANWYFIRIYRSRRQMSNGSLLVTLALTICGYIWAALHYRFDWPAIFASTASTGLLAAGPVLTIALCLLSKFLSGKYADMLGKE